MTPPAQHYLTIEFYQLAGLDEKSGLICNRNQGTIETDDITDLYFGNRYPHEPR